MDIVKAFECAGMQGGFKLNIKGTHDDPLFQANQIGEFLGLTNIRATIKNFRETERVVNTVSTPGGAQETTFLTETGLYRLLGMSRKPFAETFQSWVAVVVKEIRRTGRYEVEAQMRKTIDEMTENHRVEMEKNRKLSTHHALLKAYGNVPIVYLVEIGALEDGKILVKFGESDCFSKREPGLKREYGTIYLLDVFVCQQPHRYEQWLKKQPLFLKHRYNGLVNDRHSVEVLSLTSTDILAVSKFMKKHENIFGSQESAEKIRLDTLDSLKSIMSQIQTISDPTIRKNAERSWAASFHALTPNSFENEEENDQSDILFVAPVINVDRVEEKDQSDILFVAPVINVDRVEENQVAEHALIPRPPPKKIGRPPKTRVQPTNDANTPLQRFLDDCFDVVEGGKVHVVWVKARYQLWRNCYVKPKEADVAIKFFDDRFQRFQEWDEERDMKCSFYRGVTMRNWTPPDIVDPEISAFVDDTCVPHVMGRVRTKDLFNVYVSWKKKRGEECPTALRDQLRFSNLMKSAFVYYTGVAVCSKATGAPGFYGLYLNNVVGVDGLVESATRECRLIGYNRSTNTRNSMVKLDANGKIVDTLQSQDELANILKRTTTHICHLLENKDGIWHEGYRYMREKDYRSTAKN